MATNAATRSGLRQNRKTEQGSGTQLPKEELGQKRCPLLSPGHPGGTAGEGGMSQLTPTSAILKHRPANKEKEDLQRGYCVIKP